MRKSWLIAVIGAMLSVGCAKNMEVEPELNMKEQFEQRKAIHDSRYETLKALEDKELGLLLWEEERAIYFREMRLSIFSTGYDFHYTLPQLYRLNDYASTDEMTDAYLQSLLAISSFDHRECMRYSGEQGFALQEGFLFPFRHSLNYSQMLFDDGDIQQLSDIADRQPATAASTFMGDHYCYTGTFGENEAQPVAVIGEFHAEFPQRILEFEFTAADVGSPVEQDGYIVTLLEFDENRYAIEIDAVEGQRMAFGNQDILAEAVTANGEYISWQGWQATERQPPARVRRINELLDDLIQRAERGSVDSATARTELEALRDTFNEEQGRTLYLGRAFSGRVDKAIVTLMVYSDDGEGVAHDLKLPVYSFPDSQVADEANLSALPEIPITAPVYHERAELRTSRVELNAQEMEDLIEATTWPGMPAEDGEPGSEQPAQVSWYYPSVQSDLFIEKSMRMLIFGVYKIDFYDENDQLVEDPELANIETEIPAYEFALGTIEYPFMAARLLYYPERFTGKPARVKGVIPVLVSTEFKESYAKNELPPGITLNGNQLIVDYAQLDALGLMGIKEKSPERRNPVFVKDSQGYLAEMTRKTVSYRGAGQSEVDVYYFYGEPETVEIWYQGEITTLDYEYDIKLD